MMRATTDKATAYIKLIISEVLKQWPNFSNLESTLRLGLFPIRAIIPLPSTLTHKTTQSIIRTSPGVKSQRITIQFSRFVMEETWIRMENGEPCFATPSLHQNYLEDFFNTHSWNTNQAQSFWLNRSGKDLKTCISNKFLGDVDATDLRVRIWGPLV